MHSSARRASLLALASALLVFVLGPAAAVASTSTSLLGETSIPRLDRQGTPADSTCPAGSFADGVRVWYDGGPTAPLVNAVGILCHTDGGAILGDVVGATNSESVSGDSLCNGDDLATGLSGGFGEVMNAIGVRCTGAAGVYDAPRVGNQTTANVTADCAVGSGLTGLTAWSGVYGGPIHVYGVQGACDPLYTVSGVLQPINADGSSVFKVGSTIPVKFTATDTNGAPVTNLSATLTQTLLTSTIEGTYMEADTNVAATSGFRYDPTSGQYIFNWSTKGLAPGTYRIRISITNGPDLTADLSLR